MSEENQDKLSAWKSWLIKKLLNNDSSKEEILNIIASEEESDVKSNNHNDNNERNLIKNILQLENKSVEDVMVPRGEIISIDNKQNYEAIFNLIKEESHSRLPVYEKNLDNIIGFFHVKDFITVNDNSMRDGEPLRVQSNPLKIKNDIGWKASKSIYEVLDKMYDYTFKKY